MWEWVFKIFYFSHQGHFLRLKSCLSTLLADQKSIYPSAKNHFSLISSILYGLTDTTQQFLRLLLLAQFSCRSNEIQGAHILLLLESHHHLNGWSYEIKCFCNVNSHVSTLRSFPSTNSVLSSSRLACLVSNTPFNLTNFPFVLLTEGVFPLAWSTSYQYPSNWSKSQTISNTTWHLFQIFFHAIQTYQDAG